MKKMQLTPLLLLFGIVFTLHSTAQNVTIPDANFKAYLVGNTSINTNADTEVQVSEAGAFTGLIDCNGLNISDLTGIEAFTNLTQLRCYNNQLTTLNVSNNTALTLLYCNDNQLTGLDVSNNTALIDLRCFENPLGSLDVSSSLALERLYCYQNQLTSIDVSNNTSLLYFRCNNNQLTSLNISNNTSLIDLYAVSNQLTSLDVTNNMALENLSCGDNNFNTIDVSNNLSLIYLHVYDLGLTNLDVSNNMVLERLYCYDNQLTIMDLSGNTSLITFWAYNNELLSLNFANGNNANTNDYSFRIQQNPNLTCVQVDDVTYSDTTWTYVDAQTSFSSTACPACIITIPDANFKTYLVGNMAINTNSNSEIECTEAAAFTGAINCGNLNIADFTGLEAFTALTEFRCQNNNATSLDLSMNTNLTFLWCGGNPLDSLVLDANVALTYLSCRDNGLTDLDISNNTLLTEFDCAENQLTSLDVSNNTLLTYLGCHGNDITALDVLSNVNLLDFQCYENQITTLDVSTLDSLQYLGCYTNQLTSLDISQNMVLVQLGCDNNQLTSLNAANGSNTLMSNGEFTATNNPNLFCIQVDDTAYSNANWAAGIDFIASFSLNCAAPSVNNLTETACDSFTVGSITYTMSGMYSDTLVGAAASGVDSIVNLDLTINLSTSGVDTQTAVGSYTWINGNTYTEDNSTATHTITNASGCDSVITLNLTVTPLGLNEFSSVVVKVFPNPSSGVVNIALENYKDAVLSIFNAFGQEVMRIENVTPLHQFELESGTYFVQIRNKNEVITRRFVVVE